MENGSNIKGRNKGDGVTEATKEAAQEAEAKKDVTLRFSWWGGDTRHEAMIQAIKLIWNRIRELQLNMSIWDLIHEKS